MNVSTYTLTLYTEIYTKNKLIYNYHAHLHTYSTYMQLDR